VGLLKYPGYAPSNVAKDAKYSVVHGTSGAHEVRLVYRVSNREKWMLTTDKHEPLVRMVNDVKNAMRSTPGGAFYINEFHDVLVPADDGGVYYAGSYSGTLEFRDGPLVVSPKAPDGLKPGDAWPGPHVGIRYTLMAGAQDIRYELREGKRSLDVHLSDEVGPSAALALAKRLGSVKGASGGRMYINERMEFFAPVDDAYLYLGNLEDDRWFAAPDGVDRP
jgi:hypothetical protein